jgi:hypothetical protein
MYRKRYGRYPTSLKEMYDTRPRTLRKLWKDPMTNSVEWGLVNPGAGTPIVLPGTGGDKGKPPGSDPRGPRPLPTPTPSASSGFGSPPQNALPVAGVHSKSEGKAFRQYQGRDTYSQWVFTEQSLFLDRRTGQSYMPGGGTMGGGPGGGGPGGGGAGQEIPGGGPGTGPKK